MESLLKVGSAGSNSGSPLRPAAAPPVGGPDMVWGISVLEILKKCDKC